MNTGPLDWESSALTTRPLLNSSGCQRSYLKAILKYRKHPSILEIKRRIISDPVFSFNHITKEDVIKEIKNLEASKASEEDDIPTKTIKENSDIFSNFTYQSFNNMTDVCIFQHH